MRPGPSRWRSVAAGGAVFALLVAVLVVAVVAPGRRYSTPAGPLVKIAAGRPTTPWVTVRSGSTVTWANTTDTTVRLDPAPVSVSFPGRVTIEAGARRSMTFLSPGLFVYGLAPWSAWTVSDYSHTSIEGPLGLPDPRKGAPGYPEPGFGAVAVVGADPHAPSHVTVALPWNYYDPAYTIIRSGGSITWQSLSRRSLTATTAPGAAPVPFDVAVPPLASVTRHLAETGMYVYYSRHYVTWDRATGLPIPARSSDIYPIAQVGIVVVEPS